MDLLPHPTLSSGGVEPLEIPFVADTPYTGGSYWDFPLTHGFGDRWTALPASRLSSLAQSWLYFGTISEFLEREVDYREFRRFRQAFAFEDGGDADGPSVTAKPLFSLLDQWFKARDGKVAVRKPSTPWKGRAGTVLPASTHHAISSDDTGHELDDHAAFLDKVFDLAEDFEKLSQGHVYPIPAIILSVKILCITLSSLLRDRVQLETGQPPPSWPRTVLRRAGTSKTSSLPSSQLLLDMFQQRRWCPFQVGKIISTHNYAVVYYFTRLHQEFSPYLSHKRCSETGCVASNITDLAGYYPKHTDPSCSCRHLSARQDQVRKIIMEGGIPLVRVTTSPRRKPSVKVVKMTPWTRFVAFSHVWSDMGLGNPRANTLPKCQLKRLQEYADGFGSWEALGEKGETRVGDSKPDSYRSRYFWIDSLCIPAGEPTDEARVQAMNRMAAVFQVAERVLILDQTLQNISLARTNRCEALARLAVSPWNGRSWTYMEASLSSVCEVQCADGTFNPFLDHQGAASHRNKSLVKYLRPRAKFMQNLFEKPPISSPLLQIHLDEIMTTSTKHIQASIATSLSTPLIKELQSSFDKGIRRNPNYPTGNTPEKTDLCTLFVHAWNELSKKSSTIPTDKHIILACLLGFNTQPIMRLTDPKARMATILRSMDGLPVSLFLNNLPRLSPSAAPDARNANNWAPLYPSRHRLKLGSRYTNIRYHSNGDLYFPNNRVSRREVSVFMLTPDSDQQRTGLGPGQFRMRDPSNWGTEYSVKLQRGDRGGFKSATPVIDNSGASYCVLFQHHGGARGDGTARGGSLFKVLKVMINTPSDDDGGGNGNNNGSDSSLLSPGMPSPGYAAAGLGLISRFSSQSTLPTPTGAQIEFPFPRESGRGLYGGGGGGVGGWRREFAASELSLVLGRQEGRGGDGLPGMMVRVVYECPVVVSRLGTGIDEAGFNFGFAQSPVPDQGEGEGRGDDEPVVEAVPLPVGWQMVLERETPHSLLSPPQPLTTHIPSYKESTGTPPIFTTCLLTALDGFVAAGCVSLALAICFTLLPRDILTPISSAAVILKLMLHSATIIWIFLFDSNDDEDNNNTSSTYSNGLIQLQTHKQNKWYTIAGISPRIWAPEILHMILVSIYTCDRAAHRINILDRTFIYWSFIGHAVNILTRVLTIRYWVIPSLWSSYLHSFNDAHTSNDNNTLSPRQPKYHHTNTSESQLSLDQDHASETTASNKARRGLSPTPSEEANSSLAENDEDDDFVSTVEGRIVPVWDSPYGGYNSRRYTQADLGDTQALIAGQGANKRDGDGGEGGKNRNRNGNRMSPRIGLGLARTKGVTRSGMNSTRSRGRGVRGGDKDGDGDRDRGEVMGVKVGGGGEGGKSWWDVVSWGQGQGPLGWIMGTGADSKKGKKRKKQKIKRTDSLVVEVAESEISGQDMFDRSSWRSGDYLLGEQHVRRGELAGSGERRGTGGYV